MCLFSLCFSKRHVVSGCWMLLPGWRRWAAGKSCTDWYLRKRNTNLHQKPQLWTKRSMFTFHENLLQMWCDFPPVRLKLIHRWEKRERRISRLSSHQQPHLSFLAPGVTFRILFPFCLPLLSVSSGHVFGKKLFHPQDVPWNFCEEEESLQFSPPCDDHPADSRHAFLITKILVPLLLLWILSPSLSSRWLSSIIPRE